MSTWRATALRIALGRSPVGLMNLLTPLAHAGNYIVRTGGTGVIAGFEGLAELAHDVAVRHVAQFMHPGDEVRAYPDFSGYPAFVLSVHDTAEQLEAFHDRLDSTVAVRYR